MLGRRRVPGRADVGVRPADDDEPLSAVDAGPVVVVPGEVTEQGAAVGVVDERQQRRVESLRAGRDQVRGTGRARSCRTSSSVGAKWAGTYTAGPLLRAWSAPQGARRRGVPGGPFPGRSQGSLVVAGRSGPCGTPTSRSSSSRLAPRGRGVLDRIDRVTGERVVEERRGEQFRGGGGRRRSGDPGGACHRRRQQTAARRCSSGFQPTLPGWIRPAEGAIRCRDTPHGTTTG